MGILVRGLGIRFCAESVSVRKRSAELQELGRRIRAARTALGLSQEDLANESDIDRSYIGGVERGERNLTFKVLCKIAAALRCDVATLTKGLPARPR
jgi:transcriptional regulator with XRE-family HTH domain